MLNFFEKYNQAPESIKNFLNSENYFSFLDEYAKKFELEENEVALDFLLRDIAVKAIEADSIDAIVAEIKSRLNFDQEQASGLGHFIFSRFLPLIKKRWESWNEQVEAEKQSDIQALLDEIKKQETPRMNSPVINLNRAAPNLNQNRAAAAPKQTSLDDGSEPFQAPAEPIAKPPEPIKIESQPMTTSATPKPMSADQNFNPLGKNILEIPAEPTNLKLKDADRPDSNSTFVSVKEIKWPTNQPSSTQPANAPRPNQSSDSSNLGPKIIIKKAEPEKKDRAVIDLSNL